MSRASPKKYQKKRNYSSFSIYIYKVLKSISSDVGISKKGMIVLNSLIIDLFDQIALEASKLLRYQNKKTLSSNDIQTAIKLILPNDLGDHAVSEGNSAIFMYNQNKNK